MDTRAAGVTVALAAPSPAAAVRYQAESLTPFAALTVSYALVHPLMATPDEAGVSSVVTRTVPCVVPAGNAVVAVPLERAVDVLVRPTWLTPEEQVSVTPEEPARATRSAEPAHA